MIARQGCGSWEALAANLCCSATCFEPREHGVEAVGKLMNSS